MEVRVRRGAPHLTPATFCLPGRDRPRREMEQNGPFPNLASKLPNLNFFVYVMVALRPLFYGVGRCTTAGAGASVFPISCTEEARSGVYFAERACSKTRILVLFLEKMCDFGQSY